MESGNALFDWIRWQDGLHRTPSQQALVPVSVESETSMVGLRKLHAAGARI